MARLSRKALSLFGSAGASSNFGQFGSQKAGDPVLTKDVETIQGIDAWTKGWQEAVELNQAPYLEDMNGLLYVFGYELAYLFQEGIPEWNALTTYYEGSIVKATDDSGFLYVSLTDDNLNNALPAQTNNANWFYLNLENDGVHIWKTAVTYQTGYIVRKDGTSELYASKVDGNQGNALPAQTSNGNWAYLQGGIEVTARTPTVTVKVNGDTSYTIPAGCKKLIIRMKGGGGGGAGYFDGAGGAAGGNGGDTVWDSAGANIHAGGGLGGTTDYATNQGFNVGGAGGLSATGAPALRQKGQNGGNAWGLGSAAVGQGGLGGGQGGGKAGSAYGGAGQYAGGAGGAKTGGGGGGGGGQSPSPSPGGGGGEGEEALLVIANPAGAAYTIAVGAGGTAGGNGAAGGTGVMIIEEHYN